MSRTAIVSVGIASRIVRIQIASRQIAVVGVVTETEAAHFPSSPGVFGGHGHYAGLGRFDSAKIIKKQP